MNEMEVRLWGQRVGLVAESSAHPGVDEFEYDADFVRAGFELSPLTMPLAEGARQRFPALNRKTFRGLPGLLADALPDKFGTPLMDEALARRGVKGSDISSLKRLAHLGDHAMGALEFAPVLHDVSTDPAARLDLAQLVEDAKHALRRETTLVGEEFLRIGGCAGGARAKAVIGWNPETGEIVSGRADLPPGFEHWLLKFDGVGDDGALGRAYGFGRIEYAHYLMAREAGIRMSECRLLEENGRAHFVTRRFDREGNGKLHVQSLCGLAHLDFNTPREHSYEKWLQIIVTLKLGEDAVEQAWLRCVFNVMVRNCDDHTRNIAFLMRPDGRWELAPAYDLAYAHNPAVAKWTRQHQMLVAGKADEISKEDLLALATRYGVARAIEKYERVRDAVRRWPAFAREAGVPEEEMRRIASFQELVND